LLERGGVRIQRVFSASSIRARSGGGNEVVTLQYKPNSAVVIYSNGIVHCSVCVEKDLSREEIEAQVNAANPAGTTHGWKIDEEPFAEGAANPHPCEDAPEERLHYLMVC
jgi:hypothetical protein